MHINIKSEKHILKYHRIFDILTKNIEERYNNHTLEHYFNTKYNPFIEVLTEDGFQERGFQAILRACHCLTRLEITEDFQTPRQKTPAQPSRWHHREGHNHADHHLKPGLASSDV